MKKAILTIGLFTIVTALTSFATPTSLQVDSTNKIDNFDEKGEILFRPLLEKYGYSLEEKKTNEINGQKWS